MSYSIPGRIASGLVVALALCDLASAGTVSVRKVEAIEGRETTLLVHLSGPLPAPPHSEMIPKGDGQPDRLAVDLPGADMNGKPSKSIEVGWGGVQRMRLGMPTADAARLVLELDAPTEYTVKAEGDDVKITLRAPAGSDGDAPPGAAVTIKPVP